MGLDKITYIKTILEMYDNHEEIYKMIVPTSEELMSLDKEVLLEQKRMFDEGEYSRDAVRKRLESSLANESTEMQDIIYKGFLEVTRKPFYDQLEKWLSTPVRGKVITR